VNPSFGIFVLVWLLTACGPVAQRSLTFQECEALYSVIEEREKYDISAPSGRADRQLLQSCLSFPYKEVLAGAAPQRYTYARSAPSSSTPSTGPGANETVSNEVRLVTNEGIFSVPVVINGTIKIPFVLDSGAADVQLPAEVVLTLVRTGTLSQEDFLSGGLYILADGSTLRSPRFNIREMRVGNHVARNVAASVGPAVKSDALLGQSFLSKFRFWTLDNGPK
jgi:predicted aspartyl protease